MKIKIDTEKHLKNISENILNNENSFLKVYYKTILNESFENLYPLINFINIILTKKNDIIKNIDKKDIKKKISEVLKNISNKIQKHEILIQITNSRSIEIKDNINKKYFILNINTNNKKIYYLKKFLNKFETNSINTKDIYEIIEKINTNENFLKIKNKYQKIDFFLNKKLNELNIDNISKFIKLEDENLIFKNEYLLLKYTDIELLIKEYKNFYNIFLYSETEETNDVLNLLLQISSLIVDEGFYLNKLFVNKQLYKLLHNKNLEKYFKIKQEVNKNKQ